MGTSVDTLARAHGFEALRVEGELPADLAGTLYRCGPGLRERFGVRLPHPFEADGVSVALRFDGAGGVEGATRVIESAAYLEEQAAGRFLYGPGAPWLRRMLNSFKGKIKNTGNTRAWTWEQRLFALVESNCPLELDPDTLEVIGESDLGGALVGNFSAHPHRIAGTDTWINFGLRYGRETLLDVYRMRPGGEAECLASVPCRAGMIHDFALTTKHAVFFCCPASLVVGRALLQLGDFTTWFRWRPELGCEVLVVPIAEPGPVERFQSDPFWVWHFVNAFEQGEEIVIDYCRYPDLGSLSALAGGELAAPPELHRARIDAGRTQLRSEPCWDVPCEFPRVAPSSEGVAYRDAWVETSTEELVGTGLARIRPDSGEAERWEAPGLRTSEPVPVPRAGGESPWILSMCHDREGGPSSLCVLDGGNMGAGPIARVHFDQALPLTFHGDWMG